MNPETARLFVDALVAIGMGLLIGLEREHRDVTQHEHDGEGKPRLETALGVRTFALLSMIGWICGALSPGLPWIPAAALLAVGGLIIAMHVRAAELGRGLTTEVAAVAAMLLGMLVHHARPLAVALALAVTLLLVAKPWFVSLVPKLRRTDLTSTLQLLIVLAIVLPLLPTEARDPWKVLSPRRIGLFATLVAGINWVGYVLHRALGRRRSASVTGLVGGLASSTAVTVAMSQQARRSEAMRVPGQLAVMLASTVMFARVGVIAALASQPLAGALAPSLGAMGVVSLGGALWKWWVLRRQPEPSELAELDLPNPFSLVPALKWGALFAAILVASAAARTVLGQFGVFATAAASGLADVDAITLAMSRQVADGHSEAGLAATAIVVAMISNTLVKAVIAWASGGNRFGRDVGLVFAGAVGAGLAVALAL